jgi:hypothetical protein
LKCICRVKTDVDVMLRHLVDTQPQGVSEKALPPGETPLRDAHEGLFILSFYCVESKENMTHYWKLFTWWLKHTRTRVGVHQSCAYMGRSTFADTGSSRRDEPLYLNPPLRHVKCDLNNPIGVFKIPLAS